MKPFQLTVNGEQHKIQQEAFKAALVDCPKEVAQRQIELGYGITAVTNVHNTVLVPIAVDVHKFIFVRTPTQAMKVAEVDVLLGKKEKEEDLFSLKVDKDEEIARLKAKLAEISESKVEATKDTTEEVVEEETEDLPPDEPPTDPDEELPIIIEEDNGYTLKELEGLGHAGIVNLIVEEDETQDPEALAKKNINELVQIFEDIVSDKELEQIKSSVPKKK